ncbi:MAG: hypothetical protein ACTSYM_03935 [Candidatus Baldrarchaeia archaeon]
MPSWKVHNKWAKRCNVNKKVSDRINKIIDEEMRDLGRGDGIFQYVLAIRFYDEFGMDGVKAQYLHHLLDYMLDIIRKYRWVVGDIYRKRHGGSLIPRYDHPLQEWIREKTSTRIREYQKVSLKDALNYLEREVHQKNIVYEYFILKWWSPRLEEEDIIRFIETTGKKCHSLIINAIDEIGHFVLDNLRDIMRDIINEF